MSVKKENVRLAVVAARHIPGHIAGGNTLSVLPRRGTGPVAIGIADIHDCGGSFYDADFNPVVRLGTTLRTLVPESVAPPPAARAAPSAAVGILIDGAGAVEGLQGERIKISQVVYEFVFAEHVSLVVIGVRGAAQPDLPEL